MSLQESEHVLERGKHEEERENFSQSLLYLIRHDLSFQNLVNRELDVVRHEELLQQLTQDKEVPLAYPDGSPELRKQARLMARKLRHVKKANLHIYRSTMERSKKSLAVHIEEWNEVRPEDEQITEDDVVETPLLDEQRFGLGDPFREKDPLFANLPAIARMRLRDLKFVELAHSFQDRVLRPFDLTPEQLSAAQALGLTEREIYGDNINDMLRDWIFFLDAYESQIFAKGSISVALFHGNKMKIALAISERPWAYDEDVPLLIRNALGDKQLWNNSIFELEGEFDNKSRWRKHKILNHYRIDDQR